MAADLFSKCWYDLGPVNVAEAVAWLEAEEKPWPTSTAEMKPQRIFTLPGFFDELISDVLSLVVTHSGEDYLIGHAPMLSRVMPGVDHGLHCDTQRADWLTRIHVPLATNPGCWMRFEDEDDAGKPKPVHFQVGHAYTFNTLKRHAFGNAGETPRVHLIFEVLRADP